MCVVGSGLMVGAMRRKMRKKGGELGVVAFCALRVSGVVRVVRGRWVSFGFCRGQPRWMNYWCLYLECCWYILSVLKKD